MQQCDKCLQYHCPEDVVHGLCFRCRYRLKISQMPKNMCKLCNKNIVLKGYVYCSKECRSLAKSIQVKAYWTNHIRYQNVIW